EAGFSRAAEEPVHVLFVGSELAGTHAIFKRRDEIVRCDHVANVTDALTVALMQAETRAFDCIMVDMRHESDGSPLHVVPLAAAKVTSTCVVLAHPGNANAFEGMPGIDKIMIAPVAPMDMINTIVSAAPERPTDGDFIHVKRSQPINALGAERVEEDVAPAVEAVGANALGEADTAETESSEKSSVTKGFESSIALAQEADQQIWQRFVPLASFLYKKLAIIVLSALFLTFVTYGAMIVFFMSSSSWSLPFELSRGHALVEKTERDLSSLQVRLNQIKQDQSVNGVELVQAKRDARDGQLRLTLTKRTVEEELLLQESARLEIRDHIARLKKVIADFNSVNGNGGFASTLDEAYRKRLITRKALNSGTLAVLETLHRVATVQNEISVKQLELQKVDRRVEFLMTLLEEIPKPEITVITSAGSDLAHLAREVIEAKTQISSAAKRLSSARDRDRQLDHSRQVVAENLASLRKTPAARALDQPVMVLFVPYTNTDRFTQGKPLFTCVGTIVVCRRVGTVGPEIKGETTAVHPLFGKPLRGTFVEANFDHAKSVTKELMHVGRAPLFF
ncbi:MAG: hypothetical protein AAFU66_08080, partial [Pseudomonadota bacterium]